MSKKLYVVGGHKSNYANWILPLGFEFTNKLDKTVSICLGEGGEDWDSSWYKCNSTHDTVYSNLARDNYEMPIFKKAIDLGVAIVGICRNSQILPILVNPDKGRIVQHQSSPGFIHDMKTYDGLNIQVSSTHHECAYPYNLIKDKEYKLLGWSENLLKFRYLDADTQDMQMPETEVVAYPTINAIGYQMHPEMQFGEPGYAQSIKWYQDTLVKFLEGGFK